MNFLKSVQSSLSTSNSTASNSLNEPIIPFKKSRTSESSNEPIISFKKVRTSELPNEPIIPFKKARISYSSINEFNKPSVDNSLIEEISNESNLKDVHPKSIIDLPIELINKILSNFNLNQLKKLRLINKKFNLIINKFINELIIFNEHNLDILNHCWYFTSRKLNYKNCLRLNLRRKFFDRKFCMFKNLKNLKITSKISSVCFKFSHLNQFIGLEELDIKVICFSRDNEYLKLMNLKYLSIDSDSEIIIKINTPKLMKFYFNQNLSNIKFIDYKSIIHLETIDYCKEVEKFINLESYHLIRAYQIDDKILDYLIQLNELNFLSTTNQEYLSNSFYNFYNETCSKIGKLFDEINSKQLKIKIYLFGIRLDDKKDFYNIKFNSNNLNLHSKYYQFLNSNLNWFKFIHHYNLIETTNGNLQPDFFTKYNNIQQFELLGRSFNQKFLVQFLNSTNLKVLKLINLDRRNEFYHNLPKYCHNLSKLEINDEIDIEIDLDNFIQFNLLCELKTNQHFKMIKVFNLIEKLSFFKMIQFYCRRQDFVKIDNYQFFIKKNQNDLFKLKYFEYSDDANKKKRIKINNMDSFNNVKEACFNLESRLFFS